MRNNASTSSWTDELRDRVRTLWPTNSSGQISVIFIGEGHPFTRNAIVGQAHRLGLTRKQKSEPHIRAPRTSPIRMSRVNSNSNVLRITKSQQSQQYKLRCVEIEPRHLSLVELEQGDCRYPYGDGPFTFCGHPVKDGTSWCVPHFHLTHEPLRPINRPYFMRAA